MATRYTLSTALKMNEEALRSADKKELLRILAPIRDAANKRINRLSQAQGIQSPALSAIQKTGGKLYGSKFTTNKELIKEIQRGKAFLGYQTSTVSGARQYEKKMTGSVTRGIRYGDMNASQIGEYWRIIHKMQEAGIQLSGEDYDAMKALIRNSVASEDPASNFLNSLPAESHDYIRERMPESDDPVDRILGMIGAYTDWKVDEGYEWDEEEDEEGEEEDWLFL